MTRLKPPQLNPLDETGATVADGTYGMKVVGGIFKGLAALATVVGLPVGGSAGQVLAKNSGTNYDAGWQSLSALTVPSPYYLDPAALHATYGDHFTSSSLAAKWTRVGYVSGDEIRQDGGGSWLTINNPRAPTNYYWQTAPAGDFTVVMGLSVAIAGGGNSMFGPMIMDNSANGVGAFCYPSTEGYYCAQFVAGTYSATGQQTIASPGFASATAGRKIWMKLRKSGTSYFVSVSLNGFTWRKETPAFTSFTTTPTRIGFGGWFGTMSHVSIDFFDVQ